MDWKQVIRATAPTIGTALGGPLTGAAVKALSNLLLGKEDGTEAEVQAAVEQGLSPEQVVALRKLDNDFQVRMKELDIDVMRLDTDFKKAELADVQDARGRDVKLQQAGYHNVRADWMVALDVAGLVLSLLCMLGLGYVKAHYKDALSEGVFTALLTQFSTLASYFGLCLRDAHQFEFGSSRSSREKDAILAKR